MDIIQDQIRELQTSVRRQRFAIVALGAILAGFAFIGAVRPSGNATFDTITCKEWIVVDKDGNTRITAYTANGGAGVSWRDRNGQPRIVASALANGTAGVSFCDKDEKGRLTAFTHANGDAIVSLRDKNEKPRIVASTLPNGVAGATWFDGSERMRIAAGTSEDGTVVLPTFDATPSKE